MLAGLLLMVPASVKATVGLEYLGPYPFNPKPVQGMERTLADSGTVGNSGNEPVRITLSIDGDEEFNTYFMASFSENNFTLNPQERRPFTAYFTFKPDTPIKDYNLSINIVAGAVNLPPNASPGKASFNLPVTIVSTAVPEFPIPAAVLAAAVFLIAAFHGRRPRKRTVTRCCS
jgi:hypothetical protein